MKKSGMMHVALQFAYMSLNHIKIGNEKPHSHHYKVPLQVLSWWRTSEFSFSFLFFLNSLLLLQREFDENEVDPYHGQQDKKPEPEAMDLPDDLNLDQEEQEEKEEAGDDGEGKGQSSAG